MNNSFDIAKVNLDLGRAYEEKKTGNRAYNIEKAINYYKKSLEIFTELNKTSLKKHVLADIGMLYTERLIGNKSENIEIAINYMEQATEFFKNEHENELLVAECLNNLAIAYRNRFEGNKSKNIEKSIEYYKQSLKIFEKNNNLFNIATTLLNLGAAYSDKFSGNYAKNIEKSIKYLEKARHIFNSINDEFGIANTDQNLGCSYKNMLTGDGSENIEKSIEHYEQALKIFEKYNDKLKISEIKMNLGVQYKNRLTGDESENIEKSIEYYEQALKIRENNDDEIGIMVIKLNLANSYAARFIGEKSNNIEIAKKYAEEALKISLFHKDLQTAFSLFGNLGFIYQERILGDKSENMEKAISLYKEALEMSEYFNNENQLEFAKINLYLGNIYIENELLGKQYENIEISMDYLKNALNLFQKVGYKIGIGLSQIALADAYLIRQKGKEHENLLKAEDLLKKSIINISHSYSKIMAYEKLFLFFEEQNKRYEAYATLKNAIEFAENTRISYIIPEHKVSFFNKVNFLYLEIIKCCIILAKDNIKNKNKFLKYKKELFKYIEMSKTRALIDVINSKSEGRIVFDQNLAGDDEVLAEKIKELDKLEHLIANIEILENSISKKLTDTRSILKPEARSDQDFEKLKSLKKNKETLQGKRKSLLEDLYKYPNIKARLSEIYGEIISVDELKKLIGKEISIDTAILQYYISDEFYIINIITKDGINFISEEDSNKATELKYFLDIYYNLFEFFGKKNLSNESFYQEKIDEVKSKYSELKNYNEPNEDFVDFTINMLGEKFYEYLLQPTEKYTKEIKRFMFIPHSRLHNFAFNILKKDKKFLIDNFEFYKLPSASIWSTLKDRKTEKIVNIVAFAVSDYQKYTRLENVPNEVNNLKDHFPENLLIFSEDEVTPDIMKKHIPSADILFLMGHGYFENNDSGYVYTDKENQVDPLLSISSIFSSFPSFKNNSLVMLSICHGGQQIIKGEEIIGMNSVFLMLRAGGIISNTVPLYDNLSKDFSFSNDFSNIFNKKLSDHIYDSNSNNDKLDIFYQTLREIKSGTKYSSPEFWCFLEFMGNPSF